MRKHTNSSRAQKCLLQYHQIRNCLMFTSSRYIPTGSKWLTLLKTNSSPLKIGLPKRKCHLRIIHFQVRFVSFRKGITYNNGSTTKTYSPGSILKRHWYYSVYSVYGAQHWGKGTNIHSDHLIFQPAFFGQLYIISSCWLDMVYLDVVSPILGVNLQHVKEPHINIDVECTQIHTCIFINAHKQSQDY